MKETMNKEMFAEKTLQYVEASLPEELTAVKIRTASMNLQDGETRMVLLVIRPWEDITVGFFLDRWYQRYLDKKETACTTAAAILNDRRLYRIPQEDGLEPEGGAVIYV